MARKRATNLEAERQQIICEVRKLFRKTAKLTLADFLADYDPKIVAWLFNIECEHFAQRGTYLDVTAV